MSTSARAAGVAPISNATMLWHAATLAAGVLIVQLWIALAANQRVDLISTLLLAVVAAYYYAFSWRQTTAIRQRAHARYLVHVEGFLIVNGSFWIHAACLTITGGHLDHSWWGPLYGMSIVWGIGLLIHTFATAFTSGFDDVHI